MWRGPTEIMGPHLSHGKRAMRLALRVASASESRDPSRLAQRTHFIDLTGPTVEL